MSIHVVFMILMLIGGTIFGFASSGAREERTMGRKTWQAIAGALLAAAGFIGFVLTLKEPW